MTFKEFTERVREEMEGCLEEGASLEVKPVMRSSGIVGTGLYRKKPGSSVSPIVWLEDEYRDYAEQGADETAWASCFSHMAEVLSAKEMGKAGLLADKLQDYHQVQGNIVYRLIHRGRNQKLLEHTPHLPYLDLAVVFGLWEADGPDSGSFCLVQDQLMEVWGVDVRELLARARENTSRLLPARLYGFPDLGIGTRELPIPMKILTNSKGIYGAAVILYEGLLADLADKLGSSLILLPSSVHEWILLQDSPEADYKQLGETVRQVNDEVVKEQEILSDHAYRFVREKGSLEII